MVATSIPSAQRACRQPASSAAIFSERSAWQPAGDGWRHLHGGFEPLGFSFEWHDFTTEKAVDWGKSFHPGSLEICLNVSGRGRLALNGLEVEYGPLSVGFYCQGHEPLRAVRLPKEHHQFLTLELSEAYLRQLLAGLTEHWHPVVRNALAAKPFASGLHAPLPLSPHQQSLVLSLKHPPVCDQAQRLWYQAKALELAAEFLICPSETGPVHSRRRRTNCERVERVINLLKANLATPLTLEELGRKVGCSHFYLCRTFSDQMGVTITQYLRQLRMERAAELLQSGKHNVTEVALEVGYSSLSHFSQTFHETFGCCPGLYPLATRTQIAARKSG